MVEDEDENEIEDKWQGSMRVKELVRDQGESQDERVRGRKVRN